MKQILGIAAVAAGTMLSAAAQNADVNKMKAELDQMQKVLQYSKITTVGGGIMGKVVKGAPYSGQEVNESTQVLGDGTRIHNETRTSVARDSEGRVRRETGDTV